ncbi:MAG TPA: hypothetical protein VJ352_11150, partial [Geodermatophilus sp.]|nr:hypothetical protein [Geodermatophilus sp.]
TASTARPTSWDVTDLRFLDVDAADTLLTAAAGPPGLTLVGASGTTGRVLGSVAGRHPGLRVRPADGANGRP